MRILTDGSVGSSLLSVLDENDGIILISRSMILENGRKNEASLYASSLIIGVGRVTVTDKKSPHLEGIFGTDINVGTRLLKLYTVLRQGFLRTFEEFAISFCLYSLQ